MPTNFYFNQFENSSEQQQLDDLVVESIQIYGHDVYYIPRIQKTPDPLMGESPISEFNDAYMIPMYIESVEGFSGEGNFLGRFGLEIRDQIVFSVAMKTFQDEVASESSTPTLTRPREGDLIYMPMHHRAFQIMFVDKFQVFYQLGSLHTWKMTCELFEYSSERFNTGIAEIDALEQKYSADLLLWAVYDEDGNYIITENPDNDIWVDERYGMTSPEPQTDIDIIQQESNTFVRQDESDIFSGGKI
jgi:hypothetical protein